MLLVISNFVYLKRGLIPSMITQFESAFNVTIDSDKAVSDKGPAFFNLPLTLPDWLSLRS